jgi:hypothetical protein
LVHKEEVGIYSKKRRADTSDTKWMLGPGFRMTLLVTIFLVLINIHNTIQTNSPKVSNNRENGMGCIFVNQQILYERHLKLLVY